MAKRANKLLTFCRQEINQRQARNKFIQIAPNILAADRSSSSLIAIICNKLIHSTHTPSDLHAALSIVNKIFEIERQHKYPNIKLLRLLIDCYGHCGDIRKAKFVFDSIPNKKKNIVFITCMMQQFMKNECHKQAIQLYEQHITKHDNVSNILFLKACSNSLQFEKGKKWINSTINTNEISKYDIKLLCTLLDFYGRSGEVEDAKNIFWKIAPKRLDSICIASMMNVYKNANRSEKALELFDHFRQQQNVKLHSGCYSIALFCSIKRHKFDKFQTLLDELLQNEESIKLFVDKFVFVCMVNGLIKSGQCHLFESIWNKVTRCNIKLNIDCYCVGILALSTLNNEPLMDEFVNNIKRHFANNLNASNYYWNHILLGYANTLNYARLWIEYNHMKSLGIMPNLTTFSILASATDKRLKMRALKELKLFIKTQNKEWHKMNVTDLKGFYRAAIDVKDSELIDLLHPIIQKLGNVHYVVAEVKYNGNTVAFDNFYKYLDDDVENQNILKSIDCLMEEIGHCVDTNQHRHEMSEDTSHNLIKYHAEKKALAFALNKGIDNILITVNLQMCNDCHSFFCSISKHYPLKNIIVIDPKTKHEFNSGSCLCRKGKYHQHVQSDLLS